MSSEWACWHSGWAPLGGCGLKLGAGCPHFGGCFCLRAPAPAVSVHGFTCLPTILSTVPSWPCIGGQHFSFSLDDILAAVDGALTFFGNKNLQQALTVRQAEFTRSTACGGAHRQSCAPRTGRGHPCQQGVPKGGTARVDVIFWSVSSSGCLSCFISHPLT